MENHHIYCDCSFHNLAQQAWPCHDGLLQTIRLESVGCLCVFIIVFQNPRSFVALKTCNPLPRPLGLHWADEWLLFCYCFDAWPDANCQ